MTAKEEGKERKYNDNSIKRIRTDFLKNKVGKANKNSFDVISMFHNMLSMCGDVDFVRSNFNRLKNIVYSDDNAQDNLNTLIEEIKANDSFKQIDLGDGYSPIQFLDEYGNSLPKFFHDFDSMTGEENSLDFGSMDYICNRDVICELYPNDSEYIIKYDKAFVSGKDDELDLSLAKIRAQEKKERVDLFNDGLYPENSFEIGSDMTIVATTAGILAFPPFVIVSGILFLLKANRNRVVEGITNFVDQKKQDIIARTKKFQQKNSDHKFIKFSKNIEDMMSRIDKLEETLPKSWKELTKTVSIPNNNKIKKFIFLREQLENFTLCNKNIDNHSQNQQQQHTTVI